MSELYYKKAKSMYKKLQFKTQMGGGICSNLCGRLNNSRFLTCCMSCKSEYGPHTAQCNARIYLPDYKIDLEYAKQLGICPEFSNCKLVEAGDLMHTNE